MPTAIGPNPRAGSAAPDDLDRLLDYDNAVEDFLKDIPIGDGDQSAPVQNVARDEDEEVQVKRKRKPVAKLDENRLLSDAGISKLRKITKSRLKLRGKGHEFSDMSRLLNTYQLWLDDLYPRAKFRDALGMVEKVGHSKRMQITRRAWLDDTKPFRKEPSPDFVMSGANGPGESGDMVPQDDHPADGDSLFGDSLKNDVSGKDKPSTGGELDVPDHDDLDALLRESNVTAGVSKEVPRRKGPFLEDDSDDDELDEFLAQGTSKAIERPKPNGLIRAGPEDDELDALMMEQNTDTRTDHAQVAKPSDTNGSAGPTRRDDDFVEDEDAWAEMQGEW